MYTYQKLSEDLSYLSYSGVDVGSIGTSALGSAIPYVHVGEYYGAQVIITGGIHARENVTSLLVMRQAFRAAFGRKSFEGGIYFLPMLNPDGALLIEKGVSFLSSSDKAPDNFSDFSNFSDNSGDLGSAPFNRQSAVSRAEFSQEISRGDGNAPFNGQGKSSRSEFLQGISRGDGNASFNGQSDVSHSEFLRGINIGEITRAEFLRRINNGDDFSLWKANANGVDLNNNFDARFGEGVGQTDAPAPQGYHGPYPFSEPESTALKDFTLSIKPALTLSYHALGREIYWSFFQNGAQRERDLALAKQLENVLGYTRVDSDGGSTGGYKDWCVQFLKIPAFTVEIIAPSRSHPLTSADLDADWEVNKNIPYLLAEMANNLL